MSSPMIPTPHGRTTRHPHVDRSWRLDGKQRVASWWSCLQHLQRHRDQVASRSRNRPCPRSDTWADGTLDGAGELTPDQWQWITLRVTDRTLLQGSVRAERRRGTIVGRKTYWVSERDASRDVAETARKQQYEETHLNMVMSEVLPSLRAGQAYSVRVWIAPHMDEVGNPKPGWLLPKRVRWTAGPNFDVVECDREASGDYTPGTAMFEAGFDYWAPMVVQAQMFFDDGNVAYGHTYAGFPGHRT